MYRLTTIAGLLKRVRRKPELAAFALAALLILSALPAPATARGNTYSGMTVVNAGTIGLVPGQTAQIAVPNFALQDGSVKFVKSTINVYDRGGNLLYQNIWINQHELGHLFTLRHGDFSVPGEPGTDRVQLWIELELVLSVAPQRLAEDPAAGLLPPTYEVIDDASGKTVLFGMLLPAIQKVKDKNGL